MGLSYHYSFRAPARATPAHLKQFLEGVEGDAKLMGFDPTVVICGPFDTPERQNFSRRVARAFTVEDPRLRGVTLAPGQVWAHDSSTGLCRLAPEFGAFLVVTGTRGLESVFGFFRYPTSLRASSGAVVMKSPLGRTWHSSSCVDSPDPRLRGLVRRFSDAGYLFHAHDEYIAKRNAM